MLKGIDPLLTPDLLRILAAMGHGDEVALVDRNFPAQSIGRELVRLDAASLSEVARAVLSVLPLDSFVAHPLAAMAVVGDPDAVPEVQQEVVDLAQRSEGRVVDVERLERSAFYSRARTAFAVVATGEARPYGCLLLTKGVMF